MMVSLKSSHAVYSREAVFVFVIVNITMLSTLPYASADYTYPDQRLSEGPLYNMVPVFVVQIFSTNRKTVWYNISGDYTTEFTIKHDTGHIYQVEALDREKKDVYHITGIAKDAEGYTTEKPAPFKIHVTDLNDEVPVFNESTLIGAVAESHEYGPSSQPFMRVEATDADIGFAAQIVYSMKEGSDTPPTTSGSRFLIDSSTGDVRRNVALDYETGPWLLRFNVKATDNGGRVFGSNSRTAEVVVTVEDSNDHAPVFGSLADSTLVEPSKLGTSLYKMYASDVDEGVNERVFFQIIAGNSDETFTIASKLLDSNDSLGELYLLKPLDYERSTSYVLTIKAFNKEASNAANDTYATTQTLKITVIDINEPPIFEDTPYVVTVTEGPAPSEPIPVLKVSAKDKDFNGNQTVTYNLEDKQQWFTINSNTGQISIIGSVDYEAPAVIYGAYRLTITATDNYDNGPPGHVSEFVDITIYDINDNAPVPDWAQSQDGDYAVVCDKPPNSTVKFIKATDMDSSVNGSEFTFRFDQSVDTTKWGFETIDSESWNIIAKFSDYELTSESENVSLIFTITDSGANPMTGTATLDVTVCRCDEQFNCAPSDTAVFQHAIIFGMIAVFFGVGIIICVIDYCQQRARRR